MLFVFMWASASWHTSRGASMHSAAKSRKLERNPCDTAPIRSSRTICEIATSDSERPRSAMVLERSGTHRNWMDHEYRGPRWSETPPVTHPAGAARRRSAKRALLAAPGTPPPRTLSSGKVSQFP